MKKNDQSSAPVRRSHFLVGTGGAIAVARFLALALGLVVIAWNDPAAAQQAASRTIPSRIIPLPDSVSPEFQKLLEQPPYQWPKPPKTTEEWKAFLEHAQGEPGEVAKAMARMRGQFGVTVVPQMMSGVPCYVVTPRVVQPRNRHRLLLDLHYGGFLWGGEPGTGEAIFMAGLLGYKAIVVDYRLLPDHPFPAAMDAMAV